MSVGVLLCYLEYPTKLNEFKTIIQHIPLYVTKKKKPVLIWYLL